MHPKKSNPKLILASASPRRRQLLQQIGCPFTVEPSRTDEHYDDDWAPATVVTMLALRKARDVASRHPLAVVIGADTIVVHNSEILEKPASPEEATAMLRQLSDDTHRVLTGVAVLQMDATGDEIVCASFHEETTVTFGPLDEDEISGYVQTGSPMDKSGAYGIQDDWGALFVKGIAGDYFTIVGLPLYQLYHTMKEYTPRLLSQRTL